MEKHFSGFLAGETLQGARRRRSPEVFTARAACPHVLNKSLGIHLALTLIISYCMIDNSVL